jgi:hypothetical protein
MTTQLQEESVPQRVETRAAIPSRAKGGVPWTRVQQHQYHRHDNISSRPSSKTRLKSNEKRAAGMEQANSRLACPYYKLNPSRFECSGACSGPGYITAHRLKEHLFRKHQKKYYCSACNMGFSHERDLIEHNRKGCYSVNTTEDALNGFDAHAEKALALRSRKENRVRRTEDDRWRDIFKILFPEIKQVPDPCRSERNAPLVTGDPRLLSKSVLTCELCVTVHMPNEKSYVSRESRDDPKENMVKLVKRALDQQNESLFERIAHILDQDRDIDESAREILKMIRTSQHRALEDLSCNDGEEALSWKSQSD